MTIIDLFRNERRTECAREILCRVIENRRHKASGGEKRNEREREPNQSQWKTINSYIRKMKGKFDFGVA